jgi:hypothetical protein
MRTAKLRAVCQQAETESPGCSFARARSACRASGLGLGSALDSVFGTSRPGASSRTPSRAASRRGQGRQEAQRTRSSLVPISSATGFRCRSRRTPS